MFENSKNVAFATVESKERAIHLNF